MTVDEVPVIDSARRSLGLLEEKLKKNPKGYTVLDSRSHKALNRLIEEPTRENLTHVRYLDRKKILDRRNDPVPGSGMTILLERSELCKKIFAPNEANARLKAALESLDSEPEEEIFLERIKIESKKIKGHFAIAALEADDFYMLTGIHQFDEIEAAYKDALDVLADKVEAVNGFDFAQEGQPWPLVRINDTPWESYVGSEMRPKLPEVTGSGRYSPVDIAALINDPVANTAHTTYGADS